MYSCQKILTNNARKACVCFHFFLLFFKATSRRHSHLSGMRIKIKVYHPSSICFPRQVRKVTAFKVLWATVPSCKHRIVQGPQWVLVLSCSPLGEAWLCWLQPVLPFPPPRHRVYSRTAWAFPLSQVCCWSELSKIMVQGGESRGQTAAQSLKGQRELAPFGESFLTTDILLMNLMHLSVSWVLVLPEPFFICISQHVCSEQLSAAVIFDELALQIRITLTWEEKIKQNCWCSILSCLNK